jgi:hypothetical protein
LLARGASSFLPGLGGERRRLEGRHRGTARLFKTSALERDSFVREGVPVGYVGGLADRLGESRSRLHVLLISQVLARGQTGAYA